MRSPVCGFHRLILLSFDPEAIVLPSGEKATDLTQLLWPDDTYMGTLNIFVGIDFCCINEHMLVLADDLV